MKNFQKIALSALVGLMALGFSAFKSSNVSVTYFRTSGSATSTSASDYHYRPGAICESFPATNCSFTVEEASAPAVGSNPTQGQVDNASILQGSYSE